MTRYMHMLSEQFPTNKISGSLGVSRSMARYLKGIGDLYYNCIPVKDIRR